MENKRTAMRIYFLECEFFWKKHHHDRVKFNVKLVF